MKKLLIITILLLVITSVSCKRTAKTVDNGAYELVCVVDKKLNRDSATLYIVEDNYQRLTQGGLRVVKAGNAFKWNGHIDGHKAAFLKFGNDSVPFFFVLGPGNTEIKISPYTWDIDQNNGEYKHFMHKRQSIIDAKKMVFKEYQKHVTDSTLTPEAEQELVARDSILSDSLYRYIEWRIAKGGAVGTIAKERFFKTLPLKFQHTIQ